MSRGIGRPGADRCARDRASSYTRSMAILITVVSVILKVLLAVVLIAVVAVLFIGVISMSRGGAFEDRWGNRLMRLRVVLQGLAVALLLALGLLAL